MANDPETLSAGKKLEEVIKDYDLSVHCGDDVQFLLSIFKTFSSFEKLRERMPQSILDDE